MGEDQVLPPEVRDEQDVVTALLATAVQAGHIVEQLRAFAAADPDTDQQATDDVAQAITTMNAVRRELLQAADKVSDQLTQD